ncbi:hypothetical protein [Corynebacterium glaucum]|uniref:hypothetical protein n=1 Tax=Corynebacterium glaucum TaxID=187491 RepID=UPI0026581BC3|nr:hypothetical protein [Corynebacterium glaucum]
MVPIQLRAGGAFLALAAVLFIFAFLAFMRGEQVYALTPQFLLTVIAAIIFGAFATTDKTQAGSRKQVIALAIAVLLIGIGIIVPNTVLALTPTFWLAMWGVGALLCALILRRLSM